MKYLSYLGSREAVQTGLSISSYGTFTALLTRHTREPRFTLQRCNQHKLHGGKSEFSETLKKKVS